ncbi:TIGR02281 family clan AA aspartic protease [Notoacmeibacter sp. MSK16QG-6]|nr:TIGR02281 family clan AA aspartic protease [Notoacmeibacter sp. MSK16QG-6]
MILPIAVLALAIAYAGPQIIEQQLDRIASEKNPRPSNESVASVSSIETASPKPVLDGWDRRHVMTEDASGHFRGTFVLNGKSFQAMVDTGATHVAINQSMARQIGLHLIPADFTHEVQTANGPARVAISELHSVQIGPIRRENVSVIVTPDEALSTPLIGMSFLKQLKFEIAKGRLSFQG